MNCRLSNIWGWEPTSPNVSESIVAPAKERSVVCEQLRLALVGAQQGWGGCRSPAASPDQLCPPDNQPDPKMPNNCLLCFPKDFFRRSVKQSTFTGSASQLFCVDEASNVCWLVLAAQIVHSYTHSSLHPPKMGQNWQLSSLKEDFEIATLGRFLTLNRLIKIVLANWCISDV